MALPTTPIETPTTLEIEERIINAYKTLLGITTEIPQKSIVRGFAGSLAGIYVLLFRLATWGVRQNFLETADPFYIEERGNELGIIRKSGVKAIMIAEVTGATAGQINAGTLYTYNDLVYTNATNATVTAGEATLLLEAPEEGEDFEIDPGEELQLVQPVIGVPPNCTTDGFDTRGVDPESDDDYFARVESRVKRPPQGGSSADYFLWSTDVEGIDDCYTYETTAGDVEVYPIAEGTGSARIPTAQQITDVAASIESSLSTSYNDRRPVTAKVLVETIQNEDYDVEILGYGTGRPPELNTAIEEELARYFDTRRASNPALGKEGNITLVNISAVVTIINTLTTAEGFSITGVVVTVGATTITIERPIPQYFIASLGNVTYVP